MIVLRLVPVVVPFSVANYLLSMTRVAGRTWQLERRWPRHRVDDDSPRTHPWPNSIQLLSACIEFWRFFLYLPMVIRYRSPSFANSASMTYGTTTSHRRPAIRHFHEPSRYVPTRPVRRV